MISYIFAVY